MSLRACRCLIAPIALLVICVFASPAFAHQNGSVAGKIYATDGSLLPGVTVDARSPVLPGPRSTTSTPTGSYQLLALPPGEYTVVFTLSGMTTVTKTVTVVLNQETTVDVKLAVQGTSETVTVTAGMTLVDKDSAAITTSISGDEFRQLPVGQNYRDLVRFIPGVTFTQDQVRGPSAGASGQDNVYNFDGVNVTLPLFGTLSAEPAVHDIAQISVIKTGARAVDFNRAGGFNIDSVSKSGTSQFSGELGYQFEPQGWVAPQQNGQPSRFAQTQTWTDGDLGGPVDKNHLFFYGSYYRPDQSRTNVATKYGAVPDFSSVRNEEFGKLTATPVKGVLLDGSYRYSHRLDTGTTFGTASSATTGSGNKSRQKIFTTDGSWIKGSGIASFKFTHYGLYTQGHPDNTADTTVSTAIGTQLDLANLDKIGLFSVPSILGPTISGAAAFNTFAQPLINQYGFLDANGNPSGGGLVGVATTFDNDNFFRTGGQGSYNYTLETGQMRHDLHAGYQQYVDSEDLGRSSNGWGLITVPGGRQSFQGTPIFFQAAFQQQGFGPVAPIIHSEYHSQSFELNDTISIHRFTFNVGVLDSHDQLFGQGLINDSSTVSGFRAATGTTPASRRYKEYDIPFSKMIQPRASGTWAYDGTNTVYASFAKFNPAASSLPRAASWDRNLEATVNADFDSTGKLFAIENVASSSGKLFVPNMDPREIKEYMVGTSRQFSPSWSGRVYFRYRRADHYWEDTNNTARVAFAPPAVVPGTDVAIPQTPYIPNQADQLAQIGSGSSYVIAELDGAFTTYREVTAETEWRSKRMTVRMSYTRSRFYGNFDQDYSTVAANNDANIFIGSSNIGDGAGRQLWDNKLGILSGDRPNSAKLFGSYLLPWDASVGLYAVAQSGQAWQAESVDPYKALTTSTSDTDRYAEPSGSRRTSPHAQLDLNYSQSFKIGKHQSIIVRFDVFNVFNAQEGYNDQPSLHSAFFNQPQSFFDPRRAQLMVRVNY